MNPAFRIYQLHSFCQHLNFWPADRSVQGRQLSVHIRHTHIIEIDERERAHPTSGKSFYGPRAYSADTNDAHVRSLESLQAVLPNQTSYAPEAVEVSPDLPTRHVLSHPQKLV